MSELSLKPSVGKVLRQAGGRMLHLQLNLSFQDGRRADESHPPSEKMIELYRVSQSAVVN